MEVVEVGKYIMQVRQRKRKQNHLLDKSKHKNTKFTNKERSEGVAE